MEYDVIIIGAGASGLISAIAAARHGSTVLVIEQKDKAGKKILATGNGKCNFTNEYQAPECYRSDDSAFAMKVLSHFNMPQTLQFFRELGIYPKERDGYYYPNSEQASSVVTVLMLECERLKVKFQYNESVKQIKKPYYTVITEVTEEVSKATGVVDKGSGKVAKGSAAADKGSGKVVKTSVAAELRKEPVSVAKVGVSNRTYHAKKLILATGGCASPKLGSDGSGYQLAKSLGHSIIKPLPALVQLKSPDRCCRTASGVRTNAAVSLYVNGKEAAREQGEILFTDYGISGIPILQLSRFAAKALDGHIKVQLHLDYLPEMSLEELKLMLKQRIQQNPAKNLEEMFIGLFNHKLSYIIILDTGLDPYQPTRSISDKELDRIAKTIKEFKLQINDTNSFENAQVSAGGVSTAEIDPQTMESKLVNGLYLTGELLDVDGTCGGYNLQWAWSSGFLAGVNAANIQSEGIHRND